MEIVSVFVTKITSPPVKIPIVIYIIFSMIIEE